MRISTLSYPICLLTYRSLMCGKLQKTTPTKLINFDNSLRCKVAKFNHRLRALSTIGRYVPQNGWFIMENPMNKWMIWGENPPFLETPISKILFLRLDLPLLQVMFTSLKTHASGHLTIPQAASNRKENNQLNHLAKPCAILMVAKINVEPFAGSGGAASPAANSSIHRSRKLQAQKLLRERIWLQYLTVSDWLPAFSLKQKAIQLQVLKLS